jgi:hypothetical protein
MTLLDFKVPLEYPASPVDEKKDRHIGVDKKKNR